METYTVRFEGDEFFSLPDNRKKDDSEVYIDFSVNHLQGTEYEYTVDVVVKMDGKDVVDIKQVKNKVDLKNVIDSARVTKFCAEHKITAPESMHGSGSEKCMHYFAYHTLLVWAIYDLAMTPKSQMVFFPLLQDSPNHPEKKRQQMSKTEYDQHRRSAAENFFTTNGLKTFAYELSPYSPLGSIDEPVALLSAAMARYVASYVEKWAKVFPTGSKLNLEKLGPWYNQVQNFVTSLIAMYLSGNFPQTKEEGDETDEKKAAKGGYSCGYGYGRCGYSGYSYWPNYSTYWPYWYNYGYRRCGYYGCGYGGYGYPYYYGNYYGYPRYGYGRRYSGYGRRGYRRGHFGRYGGGGRRHGGGGRRSRGAPEESTLVFAGMVTLDDSSKPAMTQSGSPMAQSGSPMAQSGSPMAQGGSAMAQGSSGAEQGLYVHNKPAHHKTTAHGEGLDLNLYRYGCGFGTLPSYKRGSGGSVQETFVVPYAYHAYRVTKGMMDKRYVTYSEMMQMMKQMMQGMRHLHNRQEALEAYLKKQMKMNEAELRAYYRHGKGDDDEASLKALYETDYTLGSDDDDEAELAAWRMFENDVTGGFTSKGASYTVQDTVRITAPGVNPTPAHMSTPAYTVQATSSTSDAALQAQVNMLEQKLNALMSFLDISN